MNDQMNFSALLARLDKACEKMNAGLSAIAIILAMAVLCMSIIRASEITVNEGIATRMSVLAPAGDRQPPGSWGYY